MRLQDTTYAFAGRPALAVVRVMGRGFRAGEGLEIIHDDLPDSVVLVYNNTFYSPPNPQAQVAAMVDLINGNPATFRFSHDSAYPNPHFWARQAGSTLVLFAKRQGTFAHGFQIHKITPQTPAIISNFQGGDSISLIGQPIFSTNPASGAGEFVGQFWYQVSGTNIINTWVWNGTSWLQFGA